MQSLSWEILCLFGLTRWVSFFCGWSWCRDNFQNSQIPPYRFPSWPTSLNLPSNSRKTSTEGGWILLVCSWVFASFAKTCPAMFWESSNLEGSSPCIYVEAMPFHIIWGITFYYAKGEHRWFLKDLQLVLTLASLFDRSGNPFYNLPIARGCPQFPCFRSLKEVTMKIWTFLQVRRSSWFFWFLWWLR